MVKTGQGIRTCDATKSSRASPSEEKEVDAQTNMAFDDKETKEDPK